MRVKVPSVPSVISLIAAFMFIIIYFLFKRVYSAGPFLQLLPHISASEPRDPSCVRSAWTCDGSDIDEATNIDTALMDGTLH